MIVCGLAALSLAACGEKTEPKPKVKTKDAGSKVVASQPADAKPAPQPAAMNPPPAAAPAQPAAAQPAPAEPAMPQTALGGTVTPPPGAPTDLTAADILRQYQASLDALKDYHCKFHSFNRIGDKSDDKILDFYFKKPLQVRSIVVQGANEGSTIVRMEDGTLRAKKGGVLSIIVLTLKEDDERIHGIRGKKFYDAAWTLVLAEFTRRVNDGWKLERAPDETISGDLCYILTATGTEAQSKVDKDVLAIDQKTLYPRQRTEFEGEMKVNQSTYTEIEINPGLADDLFKM
ncbi:hypothetical protein HYR69_09600 [Candidatus Sumerlaeota bacterium]|nr:hypothetical protein [Candidatus Sumerlaeota bacterium]